MRTDPTSATDEPDEYERTVLTLRVVKLVLGIVVSALTLLRLLGVL
jgi:hypothetical protein